MAKDSVARSRRSPQPGKLQIYQQQYSANLALENVILSCQQLQTLNIIPRGFLTLYTNMAEELRAVINCRIMEDMHPIEARDAKYFQDERLKWESRAYPRIRKKSIR
jgi:hypothetical protein